MLGPVPTTVRGAQATLDELWATTQVEMRAYTGNLIALTTRAHLSRVSEALAGLEGRYAGRQIIGVMDGSPSDLQLQAALLEQEGGIFVERLTLSASPEQLQGAILPLLRPATVNHVWWGSDSVPTGTLLRELTDVADQIICDSLTLDIPPSRHYALADLGWSRAAGWREALAQVFDSPDAARQLPHVQEIQVTYSGDNSLPAWLFAGFIASTLGWANLQNVSVAADKCARGRGDLCSVRLLGRGLSFVLEAQDAEGVQTTSQFGDIHRQMTINVSPMSLAEGLARVMARPERTQIFERSWELVRREREKRARAGH